MPPLRESLRSFSFDLAREWRVTVATFAASGVGYLGSSAAPIIVQALIVAGLDYQQAGDLGTIELSMLALTSTLVMPYVPHVSHRRLALGGAFLAAAGLAVSALSIEFAAMVWGRLLTGVGSGLAISGANAAIAAREDAERIFAIIWTAAGAVTATLAVALPRVVEGGNYPMGFGVLLLLCVLGMICMRWIPPRPALFGGATEASVGAESARAQVSGRGFGVFGPLALMALAGILIYSVAEQALWQFAYTIPIEAGIPEGRVKWILGFTTLMGLSGGATAAWLSTRIGRIFPLVAGSLVSLVGRWTYLSAASPEALMAGGFLWGFGFYFVSPYQIGLAAAIDRHGRVAVAVGAMMNFGYALGPSVGGRILQHLDPSALVIVIVAMTALSLLLLLPLAVRVDRVARAESGTEPVNR
jgi:predicted MFS family arabinose efflux permease